MTRIMGDSTGPNADTIPHTINIVAGYDTGTVDVIWTDHDWALFPGIPQVHIDQAYGDTRVAEAHVLVFDVEQGAFNPDQAEALINANTSPRPTIYVNRSNIAATIASAQKSPKWKGDIWLAFPLWDHDMASLPPIPTGCRYVAIQDSYFSDYDLSTVLDDSWPEVAPITPPPTTNWTEEMVNQLPLVQFGNTGAFVRRVQGLLVANGYNIAIDGIFGTLTQGAVRAAQSSAHISVDGIVGPQTWPVLLGV